MHTCPECGASFEKESTLCPACGATNNQETPASDSRQVPKAESAQIPKQYPKQEARQQSPFEPAPVKEPVKAPGGKVIICPKCGSEEVFLMENRSPVEREKNVLMACTHCKRTFHGPAFYDSKIAGRKSGVRFFVLMAVLTLAGLGALLITGQIVAFLPGTVLGGVTLAVSLAGAFVFQKKATYWKTTQAKCYKPQEKGGKK